MVLSAAPGVVLLICNPSTWEGEASLGYIVRPCLNKQANKQINKNEK
jgi:hypothetical protein